MNVRFAESCRESPLALIGTEGRVEAENINDGKTRKEILLTCQKDIFIGIFFDGTNNKYRDTPGFACQETQHLQ